MIIVSQNKKKLFNFYNVNSIIIGTRNEIWIDNEKSCNLLAKYKTEERAKEVLQEIANTYTKIGIEFETFNGGKQQLLPIYEMPEE